MHQNAADIIQNTLFVIPQAPSMSLYPRRGAYHLLMLQLRFIEEIIFILVPLRSTCSEHIIVNCELVY